MAAVVHALSERSARLVASLAAEARVDKLTGVLNRRGFEERAAIAIERPRREARSVGAATFDIDYFKRVNDDWGHEVAKRGGRDQTVVHDQALASTSPLKNSMSAF